MSSACTAGVSPVREGQALPQGTVTYRSRGVVLVIGDDPSALDVASSLAAPLQAVVFAPGAKGEANGIPRIVGGRVTRLEGHLGAFRAHAASASGDADIGAFSPHAEGTFDLVLDLCSNPLIARSVAPPGYHAPGADPARQREAIDSLSRLVGLFAKPRFFIYEPDLCAHGSRGLAGCTKCLGVCGAAAIRSAGERIAVDANLCQGCAACTLACPTGALSFARPAREEMLVKLDAAIREARLRCATPFALVVHAAADRDMVKAAAEGKSWAVLEAEPLLAFGEELWLASFVLGASRVALVHGDSLPPESTTLLVARIAAANNLLGGSAVPRVIAVVPNALAAGVGEPAPAMPMGPGAIHLDPRLKRGITMDALSYLDPGAKALGSQAAFGTIVVDDKRCTLCSGCANVCPTGAVRFAAAPEASLSFAEEACIQCGLCATACPEDAITLEPRLADAKTRGQARVLVQDAAAKCLECGAPFMPRRLLESSLAKFGAELGLAGKDLERLRLCPGCRQTATLRED